MRAVAIALCAALILAAVAMTPVAARKPRCKSALKPLHDGSRRQDSDGITRTPGTTCQANGRNCDLCCDGQCCENVTSVDGSPFATQHWVPLKFVYLTEYPESYNAGLGGLLDENLRTMNRVFASSNLWFYSAGVVRHTDSRMIRACNAENCADPATCDHSTYLMPRVRTDNSREIIVLVCDELPYLGEASMPYNSIEDSNQQYVTIDSSTVGTQEYSRGYTLVHEVGHYFGLHHTFEGCNANGDWVDDTVPAGDAATEDMACNHRLDTCPTMPGNDELNNYMNYASDDCMTQFTAGQYVRMHKNLRKYRPLLLNNTEAPTGTCPSTSSRLTDCACGNGNSALSHCRSATAAPTPAPPTIAAYDAPAAGVCLASVVGAALLLLMMA